jgi:hypothetical protein
VNTELRKGEDLHDPANGDSDEAPMTTRHLAKVWRSGSLPLERIREGERPLCYAARGVGDDTFQATCVCGWVAERKRSAPHEAVNDADAHLTEQDQTDVSRNQAAGPWRRMDGTVLPSRR